jgi:hypothetical protein
VGGFSAAIALFIFMMGVGFMTFGGSSAGFVLNNYRYVRGMGRGYVYMCIGV